MRNPTLTHETIFTVLLLSGIASCSRGERAAPEPAQPATQSAAPSDNKPSAPPPPPVAAAPAPPTQEVVGKDAGTTKKAGAVNASCGAGACSADMRKKGNK